MLTNITLENFKAFQKLDNLKVKPITILCGTNSCGKSSILQSILLLKQTLESKSPNQNILLNGRFVKLGYFEDVIFQKKTENHISLDFMFDISTKQNQSNRNMPPIEFIFRELMGSFNTNRAFNKDSIYLLDYKISLKAIDSQEFDGTEYQKKLIVSHVCVKITDKSKQKPEIKISINHNEGDTYTVEWCNLENRFGDKNNQKKSGGLVMEIQFENLLPIVFRRDSTNNTNKKRNIEIHTDSEFHMVRSALFRIKDLLQYCFTPYSYVGPLRASHQGGEGGGGTYFGDDTTEIGNKGENAPFLYLKEKNTSIRNHYFYNKELDKFMKSNAVTVENAFDECFSEMGIDGFGGVINNRIINLHLNANKFDNTKVDISQVGFGVSQIFPIVLEGLRMEQGATLLLEQPEIHLHPNLQMQMADFFVALALSGKQVIAETHSDHIVNRLVRRIIEDETHGLKDLIGIYFIKPSENGSVYEEITVDEAKGITNWPTDFFDQNASESMKIMQAGLKKRKNQRSLSKKDTNERTI